MYADAESGLYYNGQRYYDPKTCRYITADRVSVGQHAQKWMDLMGIVPNQPPLELNPFVYVANNPLRWTDPNGEAIQAVMYCAAAALIAYSGYKLYGKYDCQKNCQLACMQKYGCQTGNCPLAEGDTRGLTNCKSECVLSCWMGMGKKGPMGPTPGGPATNPPYIPPGKLD
jgi:RHS repeat-associated protein